MAYADLKQRGAARTRARVVSLSAALPPQSASLPVLSAPLRAASASERSASAPARAASLRAASIRVEPPPVLAASARATVLLVFVPVGDCAE